MSELASRARVYRSVTYEFMIKPGRKYYSVSFNAKSFSLLDNSISVAAAPGSVRLSLHIAWSYDEKEKI